MNGIEYGLTGRRHAAITNLKSICETNLKESCLLTVIRRWTPECRRTLNFKDILGPRATLCESGDAVDFFTHAFPPSGGRTAPRREQAGQGR